MKNNRMKTTALVLSAGMAFSWASTPVLAAEEKTAEVQENQNENEDLTGTLAFAQCDEYINVRSAAGTDGEITGKIYNENAVTIVDQEGDWYEITSGNVKGYVKADYFATGEEAQEIADRVAYNVAKVHPEILNIRSKPNEEAAVVDTAQQSEELEVVDWNGDWMKVALSQDTYGYVNAYYVDYKTYYAVGETLEEEQNRIAQETAAEQEWAAQQQNQQAETEYVEETEYTEEPEYVPETEYTEETEYAPETEYAEETEYIPETEYTEETEYIPETDYVEETEYIPETDYVEETEYVPETDYVEETEYIPETEYVEETEAAGNSDLGQQIADFAVQFVGNPYVYGGTSLTDGADCSGFTQSVFANFGISISRTADSQSYGGTPVDMGSLLPGDLLFYSDGGYIGHVALYIGGGQIVHASTPESGIIISNYDYNTPVSASRYW